MGEERPQDSGGQLAGVDLLIPVPIGVSSPAVPDALGVTEVLRVPGVARRADGSAGLGWRVVGAKPLLLFKSWVKCSLWKEIVCPAGLCVQLAR